MSLDLNTFFERMQKLMDKGESNFSSKHRLTEDEQRFYRSHGPNFLIELEGVLAYGMGKKQLNSRQNIVLVEMLEHAVLDQARCFYDPENDLLRSMELRKKELEWIERLSNYLHQLVAAQEAERHTPSS